jgi:hypothetical protein
MLSNVNYNQFVAIQTQLSIYNFYIINFKQNKMQFYDIQTFSRLRKFKL